VVTLVQGFESGEDLSLTNKQSFPSPAKAWLSISVTNNFTRTMAIIKVSLEAFQSRVTIKHKGKLFDSARDLVTFAW